MKVDGGFSFKRALLNAKTIGHSIGVSGVHFSTNVIPRLGIADEIKPRIRIAKGVPVGILVAKGEAEIGIHQIAELLPVPGIDIVGPLPAEIQTTLVYATGIHASEAVSLAVYPLMTDGGTQRLPQEDSSDYPPFRFDRYAQRLVRKSDARTQLFILLTNSDRRTYGLPRRGGGMSTNN